MRRVYIGKIPVDLLDSEDEAVARIKDLIKSVKKPSFVVTLNPEIAYRASVNGDVRYVVRKSSLNLIDGIGIAKLIKWKLGVSVPRITGVDTMWKLLRRMESDEPIYLFGAHKEVIETVMKKAHEENPNINIVGYSHGYNDWEKVYEDIKNKKPRLVLVALGAGRQEKFIYHYIRKLTFGIVAIGVGGSFDVWSGKVERAPEWVQKMGLEWLWRNIKEPQRIRRLIYSFTYLILAMKKEVYLYEK